MTFLAEDDDYNWYQRPAPSPVFTLAAAVLMGVAASYLYQGRVRKLSQKFPSEDFQGSLKVCTKISAYIDHHGDPGYAILRLSTKGLFFLAACQYHFHAGFWIMIGVVVFESNLDNLRVLLAYWNCKSVHSVEVIADEEVHDLQGTVATTLEPTNVYEDLTRPQAIGVMVFVTQVILIGLVLRDSYQNIHRTCFDGSGTLTCFMLESMGSYLLYLMGVFMSCVFYVGPGNSYGKKEQNTAYWLKLFLFLKEADASSDLTPSASSIAASSSSTSSVSTSMLSLKWTDAATDQQQLLEIPTNRRTCGRRSSTVIPFSIQCRFVMSYIVNGIGFLSLLHLLPLQVASKSNGMGVVFSAVGMIYLTNLDDTTGNTMTLVADDDEDIDNEHTDDCLHGNSNGINSMNTYNNNSNATHRYGFLSTMRVFRRKGGGQSIRKGNSPQRNATSQNHGSHETSRLIV